MKEGFAVDVAQCQVGEVDLVGFPDGVPLHAVPLPEKCQLITEAMAVMGFQIAGEVPPLGLKVRVRKMVAGKRESIAGPGRSPGLPKQGLSKQRRRDHPATGATNNPSP